jgi:hypothetical protein
MGISFVKLLSQNFSLRYPKALFAIAATGTIFPVAMRFREGLITESHA